MKTRALVTVAATTVAYIIMEMILHSGFLSGLYHQTSALWRSEAEMKNLFPLMILGQALFGAFFGLIYTKGFESNKGTLAQGFRYGLMMALMLGPMTGLVWYVVLPMPQILAFSWAAGAFVQMIVLGLIAGAIYKQ